MHFWKSIPRFVVSCDLASNGRLSAWLAFDLDVITLFTRSLGGHNCGCVYPVHTTVEDKFFNRVISSQFVVVLPVTESSSIELITRQTSITFCSYGRCTTKTHKSRPSVPSFLPFFLGILIHSRKTRIFCL